MHVEPLRKSGDSNKNVVCIFEAGNTIFHPTFSLPLPPGSLPSDSTADLCPRPPTCSAFMHHPCRILPLHLRLKFCARRFTDQPCQRAAAAATAWWVWYGSGQSTVLLSQQHSFSDLSRLIPTSRRWQPVVAPWRCHSTRPSQTCP